MKQLLLWVKEADKIAVLPHVRADGDALGSSFALAEILRVLGKAPFVLLEEEPLSRFDYLQGEYTVFQGQEQTFDLVIAVDCGDLGRLGKREVLYTGKTVCIDHHLSNQPMGKLSYVEPTAAATGELIYQFAQEAGVMNQKIAACIYTALSTDSGSFRYSNTTPRTLRIAADLIEGGLDAAQINRNLYEQVTLKSIQFQAECVDKIQFFADGRIAVTHLSLQRSEELEFSSDDTEGGGSIMSSICGVQVGAFFHEREPGVYKVSLRSGELVDVAAIAASFGGGGHLRASGYSTALSLEEAIQELVEKIMEQLA